MDYYKSATHIKLREYGRNVQLMVEHLQKEEDPIKRTRMAHDVARVMATLVPNVKEQADFLPKLWDHLNQLADYNLDVNAPFELKSKPTLENKPIEKPSYHDIHSKYKQYGYNVELMIQKAILMPESSERQRYILQIANIMKMMLQNYAQVTPSDEVVFQHLYEISKGAINLKATDVTLTSTQQISRNLQSAPSNITPTAKQKKKKRGNREQVLNPQNGSNNGGGGGGSKNRRRRSRR